MIRTNNRPEGLAKLAHSGAWALLAVLLWGATSGYAQAAPGVAGEPVGKVETIDGEAFAVCADGTRVALTAGSSIFQGDVLETGPGAAVGLIYIDGMIMVLDEKTRMVVDQVFHDPTANQGEALFSLVKGAFLSLSGEIAKLGDDVVQIQTPTGVISIRGTNLAASHIKITQVVLLPNPDDTVSALIFFNDGGFVILDEAFEGLRSTSFKLAPSQPTIFASAEAAFASLGISPKAADTFDQAVSQAQQQEVAPEAGPEPAPEAEPEVAPEAGPSSEQCGDRRRMAKWMPWLYLLLLDD